MYNPFAVTSPEDLTPDEIASLFVNVFDDLPTVKDSGHTFIHGPRGTGKSMMLRYLEPEAQIAAKEATGYKDLPFYSLHIPLKNANFVSEFDRISGDLSFYIGEHHLLSLICAKLFKSLHNIDRDYSIESSTAFFTERLLPKLRVSGWKPPRNLPSRMSFSDMGDIFEDFCIEISNYLKRLVHVKNPPQFRGPLLSYIGFFDSIVKTIRTFGIIPEAPLYLMLDDADNTPLHIQKVINTWVSCRNSDLISLKITTQMTYKTYLTISGRPIVTPHDYSEVNLALLYSPATSKFGDRIEDIIKKRLELADIHVAPHDFFPENAQQKKAIQEIANSLKQDFDNDKGRGFRASDDVTRYARPIFMSKLASSKKASSKYSYAGFDSLVTLANGVVRWFLEPAGKMYNKEIALAKSGSSIRRIRTSIQDTVILEWSKQFIVDDFDKFKSSLKLEQQHSELRCSASHDIAKKLVNLLEGLGLFFRARLLDESASERRVFSFMVSDQLDDELDSVLRLGEEWGYLHRMLIGSKEGLGRKQRFVLSRRLGPYFKLDVSGFAGNPSITSNTLKISFFDPQLFLSTRMKELKSESIQGSLHTWENSHDS